MTPESGGSARPATEASVSSAVAAADVPAVDAEQTVGVSRDIAGQARRASWGVVPGGAEQQYHLSRGRWTNELEPRPGRLNGRGAERDATEQGDEADER